MQTLNSLTPAAPIKELLQQSKIVAVVGLSPKESRPSNSVGKYMIEAGYTVIPVNPGQTEILGQPCFKTLSEIGRPIDIVDIFRRSEDILPIVEEVLQLDPLPKAVWMQQGIVNEEAAQLAREKGIQVIMDRCIKVDHADLL